MLCAVGPVLAQPARIAVVNSELILPDSLPAKQAHNRLAQEFSTRDRELQDMDRKTRALADKLEKEAAVLTDLDHQRRQHEVAELTHEFQRKQRGFREDLQQRRNEELNRPGFRGGCLVKVKRPRRRFCRVGCSSLPQPRRAGYSRWMSAGAYG
ncbi:MULTISPECIES: OmpH/Skp family outer membrane protein [Cupriavidus]